VESLNQCLANHVGVVPRYDPCHGSGWADYWSGVFDMLLAPSRAVAYDGELWKRRVYKHSLVDYNIWRHLVCVLEIG